MGEEEEEVRLLKTRWAPGGLEGRVIARSTNIEGF